MKNMLLPDICGKIEAEAARLRQKYYPMNINDIEKLAKEEYGVSGVFYTKFAVPSGIIFWNGGIYVVYSGSEINLPFALGHEVGHLALGHLGNLVLSNDEKEGQANIFSAHLNGVTSVTLDLYSSLDRLPQKNFETLNEYEKNQEIQRLLTMGIPLQVISPIIKLVT